MVLEPAVRSIVPVVRSVSAEFVERENTPDRTPPNADIDVALEFVRFCYRRRRVGWPALYDEMSAVAARGTFRGMGYGELAERGISFCLGDLPRLVALTERVVREEQPIAEPVTPALTIALAPASS